MLRRNRHRAAELQRRLYDILDQGRMAVCFDPNGAEFDVWEPKSMQGTDADAWARWAEANGIDRAKWDAAYTSKEVRDRVVKAVEDVSFSVAPGKILGLVGEVTTAIQAQANAMDAEQRLKNG